MAYYRRRAAEYDLTSYEDVPRADRRIATLLAQLRPEGDILEIACGTGIWTRHLPGAADRETRLACHHHPVRRGLAARRGSPGPQPVTSARIRGAVPNMVATSR